MALPNVGHRHPWLRFETMGLTPEAEAEYVRRLRAIFFRKIFRVPVLDFADIGTIDGGNAAGRIRDRLEMRLCLGHVLGRGFLVLTSL